MRIQILNPANLYTPVRHEEVKTFIERGNARNEIILKVTPQEGYNLGIVHDDTNINVLDFNDNAGLLSLGVSAHSKYGLTWFAINEQRTALQTKLN